MLRLAYYHFHPHQREADHQGYHSRFRHAFGHAEAQEILQLIAPVWSKFMSNRCNCFVLGMVFFSPCMCFFCKFGICQISISFLEQGTVGNFIESWIYRNYYCSTCRPFELEEMTNLFIDACNLLVACDAPRCTADERNLKVLIVAQLQAEGCL